MDDIALHEKEKQLHKDLKDTYDDCKTYFIKSEELLEKM